MAQFDDEVQSGNPLMGSPKGAAVVPPAEQAANAAKFAKVPDTINPQPPKPAANSFGDAAAATSNPGVTQPAATPVPAAPKPPSVVASPSNTFPGNQLVGDSGFGGAPVRPSGAVADVQAAPKPPQFNALMGTANSSFASSAPQDSGSPFLIDRNAAAGLSKGQMPGASSPALTPSPATASNGLISSANAQPAQATAQAASSAQPPAVKAPGAMSYAEEMSNLGNALLSIPKHIVSAPGYGFDSGSKPKPPDPAKSTTIMGNTALAASNGAGRGKINPDLVNPLLPPPTMTPPVDEKAVAPQPPAAPPSSNKVTRVGNSYSDGGNDISGNVLINGRAGGGTVNSISSDAMRGNKSGNVLLAGALDDAAQRGDFNAIAGYYANQGQSFGGQSADQIRASQSGPQGRVMNVGTFGFDPAARNANWEADKMMNVLTNPNASRSDRQAAASVINSMQENSRSSNRLMSEERRASASNQAGLEQTAMREGGDTYRANQRNVLTGQELQIKQGEANRQNKLTDAQLKDVERKQGITAQFDALKTDEERSNFIQRHPDVFGVKTQAPQGKDRFITTGGGTSVVDGQTVTEPTRVFDTVTRQYVGEGARESQKVMTQAQFDALPKGANYIGEDGKTYKKPG